jgi:hypothetical protein
MTHSHPGEALLEEEQRRNRIIRQLWLEERARALLLERELRLMRAARANWHTNWHKVVDRRA